MITEVGPSLIYLDSSVALRTLLDVPEQDAVRAWMEKPPPQGFISSRILRTEVIRVLRREGVPVIEAEPLLQRIGLVSLSAEVHRVAESISEHIKTLDALHLATAILSGDDLAVATHDRQMRRTAEGLGLSVMDPVATLAT